MIPPPLPDSLSLLKSLQISSCLSSRDCTFRWHIFSWFGREGRSRSLKFHLDIENHYVQSMWLSQRLSSEIVRMRSQRALHSCSIDYSTMHGRRWRGFGIHWSPCWYTSHHTNLNKLHIGCRGLVWFDRFGAWTARVFPVWSWIHFNVPCE